MDATAAAIVAAVLQGTDAAAHASVAALSTVVLVEGRSDVEAVHATAGRDLAAEGVGVVDMGGATNVGRFGRALRPTGIRLRGLYDVAEARFFAAALEVEPDRLAGTGFFACRTDLEDEFIRALGVSGVEQVVADAGELNALATLRRQPAQRPRTAEEQLHRFIGVRSGRKERYGRLLALAAVEAQRIPPPLARLLDSL